MARLESSLILVRFYRIMQRALSKLVALASDSRPEVCSGFRIDLRTVTMCRLTFVAL
jgi:hypothetical protein